MVGAIHSTQVGAMFEASRPRIAKRYGVFIATDLTASTDVPSTGDVVGVDYDKIERTASIGALKVSDKFGGLP